MTSSYQPPSARMRSITRGARRSQFLTVAAPVPVEPVNVVEALRETQPEPTPEVIPVPEPEPIPEPEAPVADGLDLTPDYSGAMTKAELVSLANTAGIDTTGMTKAEILKALDMHYAK